MLPNFERMLLDYQDASRHNPSQFVLGITGRLPKVAELSFGPHVAVRTRADISIPSPPLCKILVQLLVQHLYHILAKYWEKLPTVEGSCGSNMQPRTVRMIAYHEVFVGGGGLPAVR